MSAPTKCDKCGTMGTFAISVPCAMQCGGTMHYAALERPRPAPPEPLSAPAMNAIVGTYGTGNNGYEWWVSCRVGQFRLDNEADARAMCGLLNGAALPAPEPPHPDVRRFKLTDAALIGAFKRVRFVLQESDAPRNGLMALDDIELHIEALRAALSAEHAPPEPSREAIYAVLRAQGQHAIDSYQHSTLIENVRRDLRAAYAVDCGSRPALAGSPDQKISEPTNDELVSLGECAVRGYLDFPAAKSWLSKWLAGRVSGTPEGTMKP